MKYITDKVYLGEGISVRYDDVTQRVFLIPKNLTIRGDDPCMISMDIPLQIVPAFIAYLNELKELTKTTTTTEKS